MTVNKVKKGTLLTAAVIGRLDTVTSPELEAQVQAELSDITELILDFSELDYISSAGLRILLSFHKQMSQHGSMRVIGVNETVYEIFEVTGFSDILTIEKA